MLRLIEKSTDFLMGNGNITSGNIFDEGESLNIFKVVICMPARWEVQYQWPQFQMLWTFSFQYKLTHLILEWYCRWKWSLDKNFEAGFWLRFWSWSLWIWSFGSGTLGAPNENLKPLFSDQIYPQSVGKMVSETNFGHSKVVFSPLYFLFLKIL